ncbi:spore maturation protein, partial [Peptococcaceae bacterium SCADC1_2_3]
MVNFIWLALIVLGVIVAGTSGKIEIVTLAALEGANNA